MAAVSTMKKRQRLSTTTTTTTRTLSSPSSPFQMFFVLFFLTTTFTTSLVQAQTGDCAICIPPLQAGIDAAVSSGKPRINQLNKICRNKCRKSLNRKASAVHRKVFQKCAAMCRVFNKPNKFNTAEAICEKQGFACKAPPPPTGPPTFGEQELPPSPAPTASPTPAPTPSPTPSPTFDLVSFVSSQLPRGGAELADPNSYQSQAFVWLQANYDAGQHTAARVLQRFALACIWYATYNIETDYTISELGAGMVFPWIEVAGWLADADECTWFGISCNGQGMIEGIDLKKNFLSGHFPPEVVLVKNTLQTLNLFRNDIYNTGDEGVGFLGELTELRELNIGETGFEYDGIPLVLRNLKKLKHLDVSYCLFFGPLKQQLFSNFPDLEYLYIGGNSFNTPLPNTFTNLGKLKYFYAEFTDLAGDLSFFTNPYRQPDLTEVWIDKNPLVTGVLPPQIGSYSNLASLSLTDLNLFGPVPPELGYLTEMQYLWLYGNQFSGNIPAQLSNLRKLVRLELQDNDLSGGMPMAICQTRFQFNMEVLGADCDNGEISCPGNCCTCCGDACRPRTRMLAAETEEEPETVQVQELAQRKPRRLGAPRDAAADSDETQQRHLRHLQEKRDRMVRIISDPQQFATEVEKKKRRKAFVENRRGRQQ